MDVRLLQLSHCNLYSRKKNFIILLKSDDYDKKLYTIGIDKKSIILLMLASFVPLPIDFEMVPMFVWKCYSKFSETLTKWLIKKIEICCNIFEFAICSNNWDKNYTWQRIIDYSSARYLIWGCILHFDSSWALLMCILV